MLNKACLIGNLGKDPEVRHLNNGNQVVSFSLATSENWRDKQTGERKEKTEWHNIVVYNEGIGKVIEQYCKKGSKIYLEGAIKTRMWEKEGEKRYTTEIVIETFGGTLKLLSSKDSGDGGSRGDDDRGGRDDRGGGNSNSRGSSATSKPKETATDDPDDSIPF